MALPAALVYDPRNHTFQAWGCLICEQYAAQGIQIPDATTDWKSWANGLKAIDIFTNEGVPSADGFNDWQDWATAVVGAVNVSNFI
jgi:hypothetical protein